MFTDETGSIAVSTIIVVAAITILSAIDGGFSAQAMGQNFAVGFIAGAVSGFIGGLITVATAGWTPFFSTALSRAANSFVYNVFNEWGQTGTLENMNWGLCILDVSMDVFLSTFTGGILAKYAFPGFEKAYGVVAAKVLTQGVIPSITDSAVDLLQTFTIYDPLVNGYDNLQMKNPVSFTLTSLYIIN